MADVEVLKNLVDQQIKDSVAAREEAKTERDESNRRHDESQQTIKDYQQTINDLLAEMQRQRISAPVGPTLPGDPAARAAAAVVTRAEKIFRMQLNLRKSNKLKGIVYGKIAKKFYFLFDVLRLYRIKICIKIYMVSLGITP